MLRPGVHVYTFCSELQFGFWYKVLSKEVDKQEGTGKSASDSDVKE